MKLRLRESSLLLGIATEVLAQGDFAHQSLRSLKPVQVAIRLGGSRDTLQLGSKPLVLLLQRAERRGRQRAPAEEELAHLQLAQSEFSLFHFIYHPPTLIVE